MKVLQADHEYNDFNTVEIVPVAIFTCTYPATFVVMYSALTFTHWCTLELTSCVRM